MPNGEGVSAGFFRIATSAYSVPECALKVHFILLQNVSSGTLWKEGDSWTRKFSANPARAGEGGCSF
jgi:hypothetical protein